MHSVDSSFLPPVTTDPFIDFSLQTCSAQVPYVFLILPLHSVPWVTFPLQPQEFCHSSVGTHGGDSQKYSGNMAFTPFSPQETLQEHIKHRNRHIWHFCSQEHLKALREQLMSPSASTLCCAVLMKLHQHQHSACAMLMKHYWCWGLSYSPQKKSAHSMSSAVFPGSYTGWFSNQ